jgi:hypothetical protein
VGVESKGESGINIDDVMMYINDSDDYRRQMMMRCLR